jgi:hypothetical protein
VAAGLVGLLDGDLGVEATGRGAVPVVLARLEEDPVPGPHLLDRASLAPDQADPLGDEDGLTDRMGVPGGPGPGGEVDDPAHDQRRRRGRGDDVDVDVPGEPVGGADGRVEFVSGDLHLVLLCGLVAPRKHGRGQG